MTPRLVRTLASRAPWVACGYLLSHLIVGTALFVVASIVVLTTFTLSVLSVGVPLLIGAALVVQGCAEVERRRAGLFGEHIRVDYRRRPGRGLLARVGARWTDPALLRDCVYLMLLYLPLALLDLLALTLWFACLAGVTLPLWFWLSTPTWHDGHLEQGVKLGYFPSGPDGRGGVGVFVADLPTALLVAAAFLVLATLAATAVVAAARLHATTARQLLAPRRDPLAAAKKILADPGPLSDVHSAPTPAG